MPSIFTQLQKSILACLGNQQPLSLETLANSLNNIPENIILAIDDLMNAQVQIQKVAPQTYQLKIPYQGISSETLKNKLKNPHWSVYCFDSIDSTNLFLKNISVDKMPILCHSEMQTAGRGRLGRAWQSPFGTNMYFSIKWRAFRSPSQLSGLSLVIGLSLTQAIEKQLGSSSLKVKWPNDIWCDGKKVAGVLIEIAHVEASYCDLIIGIGVNVNSQACDLQQLGRPCTSLGEIYGRCINRLELLAAMIESIENDITRFLTQGLDGFLPQWSQKDALQNHQVIAVHGTTPIEGCVQGIGPQGQLILKLENKSLVYLDAGEVTLKGLAKKPNPLF